MESNIKQQPASTGQKIFIRSAMQKIETEKNTYSFIHLSTNNLMVSSFCCMSFKAETHEKRFKK